MIPAAFDYRRAGSVEEAVGLLAAHGEEAKLLAGGHSLLPLMKLRLAVPGVLIDVGRLGELSYVRQEDGQLAIGALTRHGELAAAPAALAQAPVLAHVAGQVGDPQVRHRGTIGGSLAHGDPASDLPAVVLALDGTLVVQGPAGRREIAAADFFHGFLETALSPDEMLVEIRVPAADGRWSFQKFNRRAQDWAIVGAVVVGSGGRAGRAPVVPRVALVNMSSTPVRAEAVETALGQGAAPAEAAAQAAAGLDPPADVNASAEFRRHLAAVLVRRGLEEVTGADR